jgi:hypothetical protein
LQLIFPDGEVDGAVLDVDPVVVMGHLHLDAGEEALGGDDVHVGHERLQLPLRLGELLVQALALVELAGAQRLDLLQGLGIALVAGSCSSRRMRSCSLSICSAQVCLRWRSASSCSFWLK